MNDHWILKSSARVGDMHRTRALRIEKHADGDFEIAIVDEYGMPLGFSDKEVASVEFCTSGGRSHGVLHALFALMQAIDKANSDRPDGMPEYLRT